MKMQRKGLERIRPALMTFIEQLKPIYGDALKSVILFGSYARGEERDGWDIDVLLLLDMTQEEMNRKDEELCELTFEYEVGHDLEISPVTLTVTEFLRWRNIHEFLQNVQKDGVTLYDTAA